MNRRIAAHDGLFAMSVSLSLCLASSGPAFAAVMRGDANCDGHINFDDITCFTAALVGVDPWEDCGRGLYCDYLAANDVDLDGVVGFDDITPFVLCLTRGACTLESAALDAELAGNPLSLFPYFHFVTAIQQDQPVRVALDPTRYPQIVGVSARIYIVANKSEIEWRDAPALTDVTAGGYADVLFSGGTIQANTFTLAAPGELPSADGVAFGVGYDVVIDLNANGQLDAGDLIDGRLERQAGFYVVGDITVDGPRPSMRATYVVDPEIGQPPGQSIPGGVCGATGTSCRSQRVFYPADIAPDERLPLVVISHTSGGVLNWYDYLGDHLSSRGFVVVSHATNTVAGVLAAASSTLQHVDAFLAQRELIPSLLPLADHVDARRQVWIGHGRGAEGVVLAYDRLVDGEQRSAYTREDVRLVAAIAPTDFLGPDATHPHGVDFQLLYGAADGDIPGGPQSDVTAPFNVFERARGDRQSTYIHGAGHSYFDCCGFRDFAGESDTDIGRAVTQRIVRAALLARVLSSVRGDRAARDYLWRHYEELRPFGVPESGASGPVVVDHEYRTAEPVAGSAARKRVIDDFQSEPALERASSGAAVVSSLTTRAEVPLNDSDGTFTYSPTDPAQGMTRARTNDTSRGLTLLSPAGAAHMLEYQLAAAQRDLTAYTYLSLRACQITRSPLTLAQPADADFTISLRDHAGRSGAIRISAYGGGLERPYRRGGSGLGLGWANEFETIRIRLTDFQRNATGLNLADVAAIRLEFGAAFGSDGVHLGIDDLEVVRE